MKTRDSISKKRQKLWQEIAFWKVKEREIRAVAALTGASGPETMAQVDFCRQEIAQRQKALAKIEPRSKWQIQSGWR